MLKHPNFTDKSVADLVSERLAVQDTLFAQAQLHGLAKNLVTRYFSSVHMINYVQWFWFAIAFLLFFDCFGVGCNRLSSAGIVRLSETREWDHVQIMFNVLDQKQTWIGISAEVDSSAVLNKRELLEKSKTTDVPVFVLGFASSWTGPEKSEQRSNKRQKTDTGPVAKNDTDGDHGGGTLFALVPWNFLNDFKLHFYGSVGLEGRGTSVPVARVKESGGASLPWQIFSGGYDSWMGSEMVCLAWMVPLVKGTKAGKKVKTGQVIGSSSKHGKQASTDPAASTEQSGQKDGCSGQAAYEAMAAQAMGLAKGGAKGKRKPKKKAAKKENESDLITDFIQFIEAPLLFGWICEACQSV